MSPDVVLGIGILAPVLILMILRIDAALVFLSLCLGDVLMQFVAPDANQFLALFSAHVPKGLDSGNNTIRILLLLLPVVLTAVFMFKTVRNNSKLIANVLPALGVGLLGTLLVVPLLPSGLSNNVLDSQLWVQLQKSKDLVVGVSCLICLFVLWLQRPKHDHKKEKHSKH